MNVQMRRANLELANYTDENKVAYLLAGLDYQVQSKRSDNSEV